jgi:hypothetical protein
VCSAPLNRIITNILKLQNKSDKDFIAYKVKTTRPQRYCVRPNIGVIPPGETIELQSTRAPPSPSLPHAHAAIIVPRIVAAMAEIAIFCALRADLLGHVSHAAAAVF